MIKIEGCIPYPQVSRDVGVGGGGGCWVILYMNRRELDRKENKDIRLRDRMWCDRHAEARHFPRVISSLLDWMSGDEARNDADKNGIELHGNGRPERGRCCSYFKESLDRTDV